jgi:hypothetical protein
LRGRQNTPTNFWHTLGVNRQEHSGVLRVRKPRIDKDLTQALERVGLETVRTTLFHGWINQGDLPPELKQIITPSERRVQALAWLAWKDAVQSFWIRSGIVAAVLAAIFSFYALVK